MKYGIKYSNDPKAYRCMYNRMRKEVHKLFGTFLSRGDRRAQAQRYRDRYIIKNRAHQRVYKAIKKGMLAKPGACSRCGDTGFIQGHHKDYNKPLDVMWLCWKCHEEEHSKENNMALFSANPKAEVSVGFSTVKAGTYRMRIKEVKDRNPEKNDLKVTLEYVQPEAELCGIDNLPLKGNAGNVFDYVSLDGSLDDKGKSKQWKLRTLTEAVGLPWGDYDPVVDLPGRELDVVIKIEPYEGEQKNKVGRYVVPK